MSNSRRSPFDRLRASRLLPAWLLVLALANAVAGFHAASHLDPAAGHAAIGALGSPDDSGGGATAQPSECPGCRLLGASGLALAASAGRNFAGNRGDRASPTVRRTLLAGDPVARWQQVLKQGPPNLLR